MDIDFNNLTQNQKVFIFVMVVVLILLLIIPLSNGKKNGNGKRFSNSQRATILTSIPPS